MTDTRGLAGGICLALGGLPLALYYGTSGVGLVGLVLVATGAVIGYGATKQR